MPVPVRPAPVRLRPAARSGQAMVEFVVGLIALLAAAVAVLAVAELTRADTDAMAEAQERAAEASMGNGVASDFPILADVDPGPDGRALTKDDRPVSGSLNGVRSGIAGMAGDLGADAARSVSGGVGPAANDLGDFARGADASAFGFRRGRGTAVAEPPPAAAFFYGLPAQVEQENEVWMPKTGGVP